MSSPKEPRRAEPPRHRVLFGERVRRLREEAGMTQQTLATKAELDRTYVAYIEAGRYSVSLDKIVAIAGALDVPAAKLFEGI